MSTPIATLRPRAPHARRVGLAILNPPNYGRARRPIFMADEPILCAVCRCLITPLSAFTKTRRRGERTTRPVCWTCRPFRLRD